MKEQIPAHLSAAEAPQRRYKGWFAPFFIVENGVVSFSLRDITLVSGLSITVALLWMLYVTCTDGTFECSLTQFPMVSNVIGLKMYDRTFLFMTSFLMFGANIGNIRAFYKKQYGVVPDGSNDLLLLLGLVASLSLPLIGVFDMYKWKLPHAVCAVLFFGCFGFYCNILASNLYAHRDRFPAEEQASISSMKTHARTLMILLVLTGLSALLHGPTAPIEWALVLYYVNFFGIASYANSFYSSVHAYEDVLVPAI